MKNIAYFPCAKVSLDWCAKTGNLRGAAQKLRRGVTWIDLLWLWQIFVCKCPSIPAGLLCLALGWRIGTGIETVNHPARAGQRANVARVDFQVTWTDYIVVSCHLWTIIDNYPLVKIDWDIFLKTISSQLRRGDRLCRLFQRLISLPWISIRHACCMWLVGMKCTLHWNILSIFCRISETLQHNQLIFLTTTAEVFSWTASK